MRRFCKDKKQHTMKNLVVSAVLFAAVGSCFYYGVASVSVRTDAEQKKSLEEAVQRGIAHCYATEGHYPESLDYLKEEYGIQYDSEKFFVDYQIAGENIMPDVTILEK